MKRLGVLLLGVILMISALCEISDGATYINLLGGRLGIRSWKTTLSVEPKNGGVWQDNPALEGRQLSRAMAQNTIEEIELAVRGPEQDETIRTVQDLLRLLYKARAYWTTSVQGEPVWLHTRKHGETNESYGVIRDFRIPEIGAPWPDGERAALGPIPSHLTLIVEHLRWDGQKPGTGKCVAVSARSQYSTVNASWSGSPAASGDDASCCPTVPQWDTTAQFDYVGWPSLLYPHEVGLRFPSVNVPQGSHILSATIQFHATSTRSGQPAHWEFHGEDVGNAAGYTTREDYMARRMQMTTAKVTWNQRTGLGTWTIGNDYVSPNLAPIVQELVDRGDWAALNAMAFFIQDVVWYYDAERVFAMQDHPGDPAPILTIVYSSDNVDYGRAATCEREAFVANKYNRANISHLYRYDASTGLYSANLVGTLPLDLLPSPVQNNDLVYFGCSTALDDSGPFHSLVFDVGVPAVYVGPTVRIIWEYWNGAAWSTLGVQDNSNNGMGSWERAGVASLHWLVNTNWAVTAINGVTGWWVRARVVIGAGDSITVPTQVNRNIYTITWPGVDIAAEQVRGDVAAHGMVRLTNMSDNAGTGDGTVYTACPGWCNRVLVALYSRSRGADFSPYLNWVSEQNPPGVVAGAAGATIITVTNPRAPCGFHYAWSPAAATPLADIGAAVEFGPEVAPQYYGKFRVFVIGGQTAGGAFGDMTARLELRMGLGAYPATIWRSKEATLPESNNWALIDFGQLSFPRTMQRADLAQGMTMHLQGSTTNAGLTDFYFVALVMLPGDEWLGDFFDPDEPYGWLGARSGATFPTIHRYLDLDSITVPREPIRTQLRDEEHDYLVVPAWKARSGPAILQSNADQALFFLAGQYDIATDRWTYDPHVVHAVQVWVREQYDLMRGDR